MFRREHLRVVTSPSPLHTLPPIASPLLSSGDEKSSLPPEQVSSDAFLPPSRVVFSTLWLPGLPARIVEEEGNQRPSGTPSATPSSQHEIPCMARHFQQRQKEDDLDRKSASRYLKT